MLKKVILKVPKQQFCSKKYFKNFSKKVSLLKKVNELKKKWLRKVYSTQKLLKKVTNTHKSTQKVLLQTKALFCPLNNLFLSSLHIFLFARMHNFCHCSLYNFFCSPHIFVFAWCIILFFISCIINTLLAAELFSFTRCPFFCTSCLFLFFACCRILSFSEGPSLAA